MFGRRVSALVIACAACGAAGHALAQGSIQPGEPENCPPLSCENVSVGPFTPPTGWELKPDRRPIVMIVTWAGFFNDNSLGVHPSWYDNDVEDPNGPPTDSDSDGVPDVFEWLISQLDGAYDHGYRRMVMRLPAGSLQGQNMASSQWWTMPKWKRTGFNTHIKAWLEAKKTAGDPVWLGVYAGYPINDPCELSMVGAHAPDPTDPDDMCVFYQNVKPWMKAGLKEYWLDASSGDWENMSTLQHSPDYTGQIHFGGEAVPAVGEGNGCSGQLTPDPDAIIESPFVATFRFLISRFGTQEVVSPGTTELCVMLTGHHVQCGSETGDEWEFDDVRRIFDEGWVIWMNGAFNSSQWTTFTDSNGVGTTYSFDYTFPYSAECVKRLHNYGQLTALADFNNDGLIEVADYDDTDFAAFLDAWFTHATGPGRYLDGDVNGDDTVDASDITAFIDAANAWTQSGQLIGVDLGPAWWHP